MDRSKVLGEEKVGTLLWKFSLPAIVGMLVNALYNVVDSIFVGNGIGEIGLTAVSIAFPIMLIQMGFGMLIGIGATALVSIRIGEQKVKEAENILGNAYIMVILLSLLVTVVGLLFLDPILVRLGAQPNVLPYARDFTRIILMGSIVLNVGFGMNNIIRAEGNPKMAMITMLIAAVLNFILNPLFIFVFKLGISGSALATVCSQSVLAIWVTYYFIGKSSLLKLRKANFRLNREIVLGIIAIGLSPFLMQVAASIVTVLFNQSLLQYGGELAVASMGIISRISLLILMPIFGINQGVQPIIGYNYGAQNYNRVKQALKLAIYAATGMSALGFILIQVFDMQIIKMFNNNEELILLGSNGLRIFLFMLPVIGFQIVSANYFQAVGKANYAIFLSMSRQVFILIPLILILPGYLGLNGVWLAGPLSDLLSSILTGFFLLMEIKKLRFLHATTK